MKKILLIVPILFLLLSLTIVDARFWTNKEGKSFEGELVEVKDNAVTIRRTSDLIKFTLNVADLSQGDQEYLKSAKDEKGNNKYNAYEFPDNLLLKIAAYYNFEEQHTLNFDSARNTKSNKPVNLGWDKNGRAGAAAVFNGQNSALKMGKLMTFQNNSFTISLWIKSSELSEQHVFAYGGEIYGCTLYTDRRFLGWAYRWARKDENIDEIRSSKIQVTDGEWHHICAIVDHNERTMFLWVDGTKIGSSRIKIAPGNPAINSILGNTNKPSVRPKSKASKAKPFHGLIDEFILFNGALNEKEIDQLYKSYK